MSLPEVKKYDIIKKAISKELNGSEAAELLDSMNYKLAKENPDTLTQFERAMKELNTGIIHAHSPQAKGRVEKLFKTLQDRLIKELRLAGIFTIKEASEFLEKVFLPKFNAKFMVEPRSKANLHNTSVHPIDRL